MRFAVSLRTVSPKALSLHMPQLRSLPAPGCECVRSARRGREEKYWTLLATGSDVTDRLYIWLHISALNLGLNLGFKSRAGRRTNQLKTGPRNVLRSSPKPEPRLPGIADCLPLPHLVRSASRLPRPARTCNRTGIQWIDARPSQRQAVACP